MAPHGDSGASLRRSNSTRSPTWRQMSCWCTAPVRRPAARSVLGGMRGGGPGRYSVTSRCWGTARQVVRLRLPHTEAHARPKSCQVSLQAAATAKSSHMHPFLMPGGGGGGGLQRHHACDTVAHSSSGLLQRRCASPDDRNVSGSGRRPTHMSTLCMASARAVL